MPYRFQATSGNIVRPIEASCLNTTTGALIWPMVYGPAGTTITMWNGVVESYSSETLLKPSSRAGSALNYDNAYDGTGTPGTTTTSASMGSFAQTQTYKYETYSFSGTTTYTKFKIYLTMDWTAEEVYDDFGEPQYGRVVIQYTTNGTLWMSADFTDVTMLSGSYVYTVPLDLGTLAATSLDNFKVRLGVASTRALVTSDPIYCEYAHSDITIKDIYIGVQ